MQRPRFLSFFPLVTFLFAPLLSRDIYIASRVVSMNIYTSRLYPGSRKGANAPKPGCNGATTSSNRVPQYKLYKYMCMYYTYVFGPICKGSFLESQLQIFMNNKCISCVVRFLSIFRIECSKNARFFHIYVQSEKTRSDNMFIISMKSLI